MGTAKTISEIAHNPLNIRVTNDVWKGQEGQYKGFVSFVDDVWGYRAAIKILLGYIGDGLTTPRQIINRWAPATENDVDSYLHLVCNEKLSVLRPDESLVGLRQFVEMIYFMTVVERGKGADFRVVYKAWGLAIKTLTRKQHEGYKFLKNNEDLNLIYRV
ncbi:MAG: hypothetical protein UD961_04965 [Bacteroidales bacterium]|nr:hypothetical protein [Bacteroidales bacterium]